MVADRRLRRRLRGAVPHRCSVIFGDLGSAHIAGPGGADQTIQVWWIAWAEHALAHGQNPFFSNWINYPVGINAGPERFDAGARDARLTDHGRLRPRGRMECSRPPRPFVSAFAMCLVLRRWTQWWPAAFVGGLLYGFCVYQTAKPAATCSSPSCRCPRSSISSSTRGWCASDGGPPVPAYSSRWSARRSSWCRRRSSPARCCSA